MGKGTIISSQGEGLYTIQINYDRDRYNQIISWLDNRITKIEEELFDMLTTDPGYKSKKLERTALQKRKSFLQAHMPDDETISAWCADYTEDISGIVGTIEVPGEDKYINIRPGYVGAMYSPLRDGILLPTVVNTPEQWFYNLAMLPGWQKWMPLYRYGVITSISGDVCTVSLDDIRSSQQNIAINQDSLILDVPIEYMDCNGEAFEVNDHVLISFTGQNWGSPKVIGFKENPKECTKFEYICVVAYNNEGVFYYILWDPITNDYPEVKYTDTDQWIEYPAPLIRGEFDPAFGDLIHQNLFKQTEVNLNWEMASWPNIPFQYWWPNYVPLKKWNHNGFYADLKRTSRMYWDSGGVGGGPLGDPNVPRYTEIWSDYSLEHDEYAGISAQFKTQGLNTIEQFGLLTEINRYVYSFRRERLENRIDYTVYVSSCLLRNFVETTITRETKTPLGVFDLIEEITTTEETNAEDGLKGCIPENAPEHEDREVSSMALSAAGAVSDNLLVTMYRQTKSVVVYDSYNPAEEEPYRVPKALEVETEVFAGFFYTDDPEVSAKDHSIFSITNNHDFSEAIKGLLEDYPNLELFQIRG